MSDHLVHDAVGEPLTGLQAAATMGVGINSLLILGVLPALLGALADEHRLSAAGIGQLATVELLAMGLGTALAGMRLKPQRLRLIGVVASLLVAAFDFASMGTGGALLLALRGGAGAAEGVLLWITVGMIARTRTPERWAGVFFTSQVVAQLAMAVAFATFVVPRYGAAGGFAAVALASVAGVVPALFCPRGYAPLPTPEGETGAPPPRGWIALAATAVYVSAAAAVGIYLQPLAHEAGLSATVARTALWVSLAAQVAGGVTATLLAGRARYFTVFLGASAVYLAVWWIFARSPTATVFIAANAMAGFAGLFLGPFLVPMTIDADPSRRAAVQSGAAQLLGPALGPWLASFLASDTDVHGVLWLAAGLLGLGLAGVAFLRFTTRSETT